MSSDSAATTPRPRPATKRATRAPKSAKATPAVEMMPEVTFEGTLFALEDAAPVVPPEPDIKNTPDSPMAMNASSQSEPVANAANSPVDDVELEADSGLIQEPRFWQDDGWTARIMKNEDDEGWAVAMTLDGEPEPALVGPWTMGRDKKNPKPMDGNAFSVLVKTAYEVRRRHEQQRDAQLRKRVMVEVGNDRVTVTLQIVPDEYEPYARLSAENGFGEALAEVQVDATFKLNARSAQAWIDNDYRRPARES